MKRVAFFSLLAACTVAGVLTAFAVAGGTLSSAITTTAPTTTVTTTTPATPQPIADGVTIGGVPVGGLMPADAVAVVRDYYATPVPLQYGGLLFSADPNVLAAPNLTKALERAKIAQPNEQVQLVVVTRPGKIRSYVTAIAKRIDRPPVDSRLSLRNLHPHLSAQKPGRAVDRKLAGKQVTRALATNTRDAINLQTKPVAPKVTRENFGPVIVIRRGSNRLYLYEGTTYKRLFAVATGQSVYPTPLGRFQVVVKWRNPWWYPPASPWAKGEKPIPPGPDNPLGTRWMGLSAPGVGIHGTNNDSSIGYSVSHGCIRMHVSDAEWLFNHIDIGTTVYIVAA